MAFSQQKQSFLQKRDYIPLIKRALKEDLDKNGDITSNSIFSRKTQAVFKLLAKDDGVLCGIDVFRAVFACLDKKVVVETSFKDGDRLTKGDVVAKVTGPLISILTGERTSLNLISHLSGVATKTARFVSAVNGKPVILDTRKTVPGMRKLQKYAVASGGGQNHRIGLYDMILIKDNHVDAAGGITAAVAKARGKWGNRFKIEVETRNLDEVREALGCKVDRIMLDNMNNDLMKEAVKLIAGKAETEASGNMTLERLPSLAECGVDFVSFGELTHSVSIFDFSLKQEAVL
ncbi:MAG TPA: carboxylating nicotinate-nucleotide diphosphorylase [Treponemataceae bacterium]|jgi:nicotinate-nucleotide pyrophosphorylase (carboxylating)|nr:carboxylating nicotinate-nucleotide diphosphorylase [Treponemataceae bacterium]HPX25439.1 carboxylating nicotinate-nucleotide diphosphorylase [Treponemataceae bacterium]